MKLSGCIYLESEPIEWLRLGVNTYRLKIYTMEEDEPTTDTITISLYILGLTLSLMFILK